MFHESKIKKIVWLVLISLLIFFCVGILIINHRSKKEQTNLQEEQVLKEADVVPDGRYKFSGETVQWTTGGITWPDYEWLPFVKGYIPISQDSWVVVENGLVSAGVVIMNMSQAEMVFGQKYQTRGGTNDPLRHYANEQLKSPQLLDAERYPYATYEITGAQLIEQNKQKIEGLLTLKGITHPVSFVANPIVTHSPGYPDDPAFNPNIETVINRVDYGIVFPHSPYAGVYADVPSQIIGDLIRLKLDLGLYQGVRYVED